MFPLELKTGKSAKSLEHQTQVFLYVLMLQNSANKGASVPGWILYLKDLQIFKVEPSAKDLNGVLTMRNSFAQKLSHLSLQSFPGEFADDDAEVLDGAEIAKSRRFCESCEQRTNCSLVRVLSDDLSCGSAELEELMNELVQHLSTAELDYAHKWLRWQLREWEEQRRRGEKSFLGGETTEIETFSTCALAMQNVTSVMDNSPHRFDAPVVCQHSFCSAGVSGDS